MIDIFLLKDKKLECKTRKQKIYEGENKFDYIYVNLSDYVNEFDVSELNAELRCYVDDEHYVSYELDTSKEINEIDITYDLTDKPRYVKSLIILTKAGEVIGKTNFVSFSVDKSIEGSKLDPREDLDEIIEELREENASQAETISEQTAEITEKTEQISELNGQVTELTNENTRLENLTDTQNDTIRHMLDNPPALEYPEEPVIPTRQAQTIRPTSPFYGIGRLEVDGYTPNNQNKTVTPTTTEQTITAGESYDGLGTVTVEPTPLESKTVTPTNEEVTYTPTSPNIGFSSVTVEGVDIPLGGVFIIDVDENYNPTEYLVKNFNTDNLNTFYNFFPRGNANLRNAIEKIVFDNCPKITKIPNYDIYTGAFQGLPNLKEVVLPENLEIITNSMFDSCSNLISCSMPNSVIEIQVRAFDFASNLVSIHLSTGLKRLIGGRNFGYCNKLETINIPSSLEEITKDNGENFYLCNKLKNVTIESGFNANNLNLAASILYSQETIVSWLNALADRTGQTAYTLTIGTTNINKLTAEQRAIATNKNWNLA